MRFRFIHAADLHIDSPLRGLEAYPGVPVERVRGATRSALSKLVDLCLLEEARFLIVAGDLFDFDWKDFNTALFVCREFLRLERAGIPVFLIRGNHDSRDEMTYRVPWPGNVYLFSHDRPETQRFEACNVAIHGMSFPKRHVRDNLASQYPSPVPGCLNVGVLHTNATASTEHEAYAPCTVQELVDKGYEYWALGHVHDFAILSSQPRWVVYSGNTQGRNIRETGPKGAAVVTVDHGEIVEVRFASTDVVRWARLSVPCQPEDHLDEVFDRVRKHVTQAISESEDRLLGVRLEIEGACRAHRELLSDAQREEASHHLRAYAGEISDDLWLEKIQWWTRPVVDRQALAGGEDLLGKLLREIDAVDGDPVRLDALARCLEPLVSKTQQELGFAGEDQRLERGQVDLDPTLPEQQRLWLRAAEALLLQQLVGGS